MVTSVPRHTFHRNTSLPVVMRASNSTLYLPESGTRSVASDTHPSPECISMPLAWDSDAAANSDTPLT